MLKIIWFQYYNVYNLIVPYDIYDRRILMFFLLDKFLDKVKIVT